MAEGSKIKKKNRVFLIITGGVLVTALVVCAILLFNRAGAADTQRVFELGTALKGVSVGGVDISGMTKEEALAATADLPAQLLAQTNFNVDVAGEPKTLSADDLALTTNYELMIDEAMAYGRTGNFDARLAAANTARETGADFAVEVVADDTQLAAALTALMPRLNTEPLEAAAIFTPNGHFADGTLYDPATYDKDANGEPQLVMLTPEEYPDSLRYEYYNNDYFETEDGENIPRDAYISRFYYTSEQTGIDVDMEDLAAQIQSALQNHSDTTITALVTVAEPTVTVEILKSQTQLVTSWTSSYSEHNSRNRVFNVGKMSGIINGQVLEPGVEWSINDLAGARTNANGWKNADGITDGGYASQPGGGVCQISSTLFNASIRSGIFYTEGESDYKWGIEVTSWTHHSIISGYIPLGLDATISSPPGGPDLKLINHCTTPFYIVSYMNRDEECVTVEVYGQTVVHPEYGDVILSYTFDDLGRSGGGSTRTYYNQTETPAGEPIPPNTSVNYAESRPGHKVQSYRHYYAADGTQFGSSEGEKFEYHYYEPVNGGIYCNYPETGPVVPTPEPSVPAETPVP